MTDIQNVFIVGLILITIVIALLSYRLYKKSQECRDHKQALDNYQSLLHTKNQEIVLAYESFALSTKVLTAARAKAINSVNIKAEFLANMSHEIRTPMAGVLGMAELLQKSEITQQQREWITSIITSAKNLLKILNDILDQSKLDAGKLELDLKDFHLQTFIEGIVNLFLPKISAKKLQLKIDLAPNLPEGIHADSLRIGQVISNLLSNALKFTSEGYLTLAISHSHKNNGEILLKFSVNDTGIGLTSEEKNKLFKAFTQADSSTTRNYGGTGLGLSISKKLVELMGGEIGVDSVKSKGSHFWFTILCQPVDSILAVKENYHGNSEWISNRSLHILLVEDTRVLQKLMVTILGSLSHKVKVATNGEEGLRLVKQEDFDLILMDIRMPVMDGLEATQIIRSWSCAKATIPIIALTADIDTENVKQYIENGMDAVCAKPLELPLLLTTINTLMKDDIHCQIKTLLKEEQLN